VKYIKKNAQAIADSILISKYKLIFHIFIREITSPYLPNYQSLSGKEIIQRDQQIYFVIS